MWEPDNSSDDALRESIKARISQWRFPHASEREGALRIVGAFREEPEARDRLLVLYDQAFGIEKRFMPPENSGVLPPATGRGRVLLATLGLTRQPIVLNLLTLNPRQVYLLPSRDPKSLAAAQAVQDDPDVRRRRIAFDVEPISEDDAAANYRAISTVLQSLPPDAEVWADPTGGRKMMVASLATVAFHRRIPTLYLHAPEKLGVVWPFSGRLRVVDSPYAHFDDIGVGAVVGLFNAHAYSEASRLCGQLRDTSLNPDFRMWIWLVKDLADVYASWDMFEHSRANAPAQLSGKLRQTLDAPAATFPQATVQQARANMVFLAALEAAAIPGSANMADPYRLADLLAAADRRADQGRYDDATARLYRAAEMSASLVLLDQGLQSTARPSYTGLAAAVGRPEADLREGLGAGGIGLDQQVTLIERAGLAPRLVTTYRDLRDRLDLFTLRNWSVLAHGTSPMGQERYRDFRAGVLELARYATEGQVQLDDLLVQARHPCLDGLCWRC